MSQAETNFKRADKFYHLSVRVFFIFMALMLVLIVFQVANLQGDFSSAQTAELKRQEQARVESRQRLDKALAETQRQQIVTQNYIRCVASVLLKPVAERSMEDFDNCGIPGVTNPNDLGQPQNNQSAVRQTPETIMGTPAPTTQSTQPTANQPIAGGSPPDDNDAAPTPEDDRSALGRLPLVGGLLDAIGL